MKRIVLVTGGTERQRNRYIASQQNQTKNRDIRAVLALGNEEILHDLEHAWSVDLYIGMNNTEHIELLNEEGCDAAFAFAVLLATRELHDPFAHLDTEIGCRLDKLFSYKLNTVSYDPKTRTGFASIRDYPPPAVGTIRGLPEDR